MDQRSEDGHVVWSTDGQSAIRYGTVDRMMLAMPMRDGFEMVMDDFYCRVMVFDVSTLLSRRGRC